MSCLNVSVLSGLFAHRQQPLQDIHTQDFKSCHVPAAAGAIFIEELPNDFGSLPTKASATHFN